MYSRESEGKRGCFYARLLRLVVAGYNSDPSLFGGVVLLCSTLCVDEFSARAGLTVSLTPSTTFSDSGTATPSRRCAVLAHSFETEKRSIAGRHAWSVALMPYFSAPTQVMLVSKVSSSSL